MRLLGSFALTRDRQAQWKALQLQERWAARYPHLFDAQDLTLAMGPQGRRGYHLVEWLGAIFASTATGYHALVSKYQYPKHSAKRKVVEALGLTDMLHLGHAEFKGAQGPDLLMYRPDFGDYFLCEVKGPDDSARPGQERYFRHVEALTARPIELVRFRWAKDRHVGA